MVFKLKQIPMFMSEILVGILSHPKGQLLSSAFVVHHMKSQEEMEVNVHTLAVERFRTTQDMAAPALYMRAGILCAC